MEITYHTVLMNLAMLSCYPEAYPSHIDLADGVVQINDSVGFGQAGGFDTFGGGPFGIDRFGPDGQRQVTEQWGSDAKTDPQRLTDLQDLYRIAMGLPPLPPPNAIAYLRYQQEMEKQSRKESSGGGGSGSSGGPSPSSTGGGGTTLSPGSSSDDGGGARRVPIEILYSDVPAPGWFCVGSKKDVPKDACYVGRYRDRYAWVTQEGVSSLARFTVTLQAVIKFPPGSGIDSGGGGGKSSGLAVTR